MIVAYNVYNVIHFHMHCVCMCVYVHVCLLSCSDCRHSVYPTKGV